MASLFGQNTLHGLTFVPGIDEYDIQLWFEVQHKEPVEMDYTKNPGAFWMRQMLMSFQTSKVYFRHANGATREDAIRSLWREIFEFEGHY